MSRFYKKITVKPSEDRSGYHILRDGKPIKTPKKRPLLLANRDLAQALAEEWQQQGNSIKPATMPLNAFANTALDRTADNRQAILDALISYANHDLLCYFVAQPRELAERQRTAWQPIRDWAEKTHDINLKTTFEINPISQSARALAKLRAIAAAYDDMVLTAFGVVVVATGSFLLGLSLSQNHINARMAFTLSHLEETYQIERWGKNAEIESRRKTIREEIKQAARFLRLCRLDDIG